MSQALAPTPHYPARKLHRIVELIGNTPLLRLGAVAQHVPDVEVYVKLEFLNPGGSVKDRPALRMIQQAIAQGALTPDKTLIDATSGNTGVAYSMIGAALGYQVELVMPKNVSKARKDITQAYGTKLTFSSEFEGSDGAIRLVRKLVAENPERYFYCDQYSNPNNPLAHYYGTGVEILEAVGDRITHFVAALGTSGTAMGTIRRLREHTRPIYCVAAEPAEAMHGLEGLKHMASSIVPPIYQPDLPDEILPVTTDEGWDMSEKLAELEGLYVGHSAGANVAAALKLAERAQKEQGGGCVVTVACDRGERYFQPLRWEKKYTW